TVVRLFTAQPIGGAELADPGLDLMLQCLEPGELIYPARQLLQVGDDQRAHRGVMLRGGDPGIAVHVIRDGNRNVLHSSTVTQFLCFTASKVSDQKTTLSSTFNHRVDERTPGSLEYFQPSS